MMTHASLSIVHLIIYSKGKKGKCCSSHYLKLHHAVVYQKCAVNNLFFSDEDEKIRSVVIKTVTKYML